MPPEAVFPSIVARRLSGMSTAVESLNWGVPGGDVLDCVILAAAAPGVQADLLVVGVAPRMFAAGRVRGRSSDSHYLLSRPRILGRLPRGFVGAYGSIELAADLLLRGPPGHSRRARRGTGYTVGHPDSSDLKVSSNFSMA